MQQPEEEQDEAEVVFFVPQKALLVVKMQLSQVSSNMFKTCEKHVFNSMSRILDWTLLQGS